jgi:hypothetical protein
VLGMKEIVYYVYYMRLSINERLKEKKYKSINSAIKFADSCNYAHVEAFQRTLYNNYPTKKGFTNEYYDFVEEVKSLGGKIRG